MRKAWLPAIAFSSAGAMQAGVNGALAVLAFHDRGIANGALLFSASAFTTVVFRYAAGRAVERFGPRAIAVPTAVVQAIGCLVAAHAMTMPMVIAAGICLGIGWACIVPVVLGLFFEESVPEERGAAMGAFHFAFGLGAALGSAVATVSTCLGHGYGTAMMTCAVVPAVSLILVLPSRRRRVMAEPKLALSPTASSGD